MAPVSFLLLVAMISPSVFSSSEPLREAVLFDLADSNQDGFLLMEDLLKIFFSFDTNNDTIVTRTEFIVDWTLRFDLGNRGEASRLFDRADVTRDGHIGRDDLPEIFTYFDMNGDGHVDKNEFLTQWSDLRLEAIDVIIITPQTG